MPNPEDVAKVADEMRDALRKLEAGELEAVILGAQSNEGLKTMLFGPLPAASIILSTLQMALYETIREDRIRRQISIAQTNKVN